MQEKHKQYITLIFDKKNITLYIHTYLILLSKMHFKKTIIMLIIYISSSFTSFICPFILQFVECCILFCEWNEWHEWEQCSESCGGGVTSRTRNVLRYAALGGNPCNGTAFETKECNIQECPSMYPIMRNHNHVYNFYSEFLFLLML